jgi:excinuclease ABC subunit A
MTELNDHLKLLYARAAALFCQRCARPVRRDTAESIYAELHRRAEAAGDPRLLITFPVPVPANFTETEVRELLARQGYTRFFDAGGPPPRVATAPAAAPAGRRRNAGAQPPQRRPSRSRWFRTGRASAAQRRAGCWNPSRRRCASAAGA